MPLNPSFTIWLTFLCIVLYTDSVNINCAILIHEFRKVIFLLQLIDTEINPYVDQWEKEHRFPAHEVFKKVGNAGFLGISKPEGGLVIMLNQCCFSMVGRCV